MNKVTNQLNETKEGGGFFASTRRKILAGAVVFTLLAGGGVSAFAYKNHQDKLAEIAAAEAAQAAEEERQKQVLADAVDNLQGVVVSAEEFLDEEFVDQDIAKDIQGPLAAAQVLLAGEPV